MGTVNGESGRGSRVGRSARRPTPYDDETGLWARINRFLYPLIGPPPLGAGHAEEPYRAPVNPSCPVCGAAMADHTIARADGTMPNMPTRLVCP